MKPRYRKAPMTRQIAPLLALLLAACGGGGAEEESPSTAPKCTPLAVVRIQLFGDSTMAGYDGAQVNTMAVHTPRVNVQAYFDALYPGKVLVTARAVSGTTAANLINGTDGLNQPWPRDVAAEIVVLNFGINDRNHYNDAEVYRSNLRILSAAPGAQVVFQTPNVVKSFDIEPYAKVMREVAAEKSLPVAEAYTYTRSFPDWGDRIPDSAHPSDAFYQLIGANVTGPALKPLVADLLCQ